MRVWLLGIVPALRASACWHNWPLLCCLSATVGKGFGATRLCRLSSLNQSEFAGHPALVRVLSSRLRLPELGWHTAAGAAFSTWL